MYFYSLCLIMSSWKISEAVFSFQCPVQSHWKYRAEAHCGPVDNYFCLFDRYRNDQNFTEFCRGNSDFEAPGQKLIVSGSVNGTLQGSFCKNDFYQPFKFLSSGNSRCVYKKSYCSEEGQVIYGNGTRKTDSECRCDYSRGFNFIIRPKHGCFCVPSDEDCSCYSKICPPHYILSPDYECLNENEWKTTFDCEPIETVMLPGSSQIPSTVKPLLGQYTTVKFGIEKYRKKAFIAVLGMTVFIIIITVGVCILTSELFLVILIHRFTDKSEHDDDIATDMANRKTGTEGKMISPETDKYDLKDNSRNVVKVPLHIKEFREETLEDWRRKLEKFIITRATESIYQKILTKNVIVIAGPTGSGKSANAYYAAFKLKKESGYTIIPARQLVDITNYHVPGTKQIFIIDDFIGKYIVNETDVYLWETKWPLLMTIFGKNNDTKLILTSRTYIWQPERFKCLLMDACTCDLLSENIRLSVTERWDICHSYLNKVDIKCLKDETISMYSFFPYLCSSYALFKDISVEHYFTAPYNIIKMEVDHFKTKSQVCFIALAILAIKQTISKDSFSIDNHKCDALFQDVFHESAFLQYPSKNLLKSTLVALTGTYVAETKYDFMLTHESLQDIFLRCIAQTLITSVLKYCTTEVLFNQIQLDSIYAEHDAFTIGVTAENEDAYFRRLVYELSKGRNKVIFEIEQNKFSQFRLKFLKYMKKYLTRDNWDKTQDGFTHLHVVSDLGYEEYVSFFLKDNAMINQKDSNGNIPLHLACMKRHDKIVEYLVKNKSIIDIANKVGLKPFFYACENNAIQVAKYLLHHSAKSINVNEKYPTKNNGTVLHIVSAKGFTNLVLLLLNKKADVHARDGNGCIPLHYASNSAVVKSFLNKKTNINAIDSFGRSPVFLACDTKNESVFQLLVEKKAEINQKTVNGLRPIHAACRSGSFDIVKTLLEKGTTVNSSKPGVVPLHAACEIGNENITKILIGANALVNHKTKDGLTPLHEACMNGHVVVTQILLDNKANINEADKHGWTALFFGCSNGFCLIVDLLLQREANVNVWDEDQVSPLMVACKENYTDVVDILLRSKANVNHCDIDNCTSLVFACKTGNVDLVKLLLTFGADMNLADRDMTTPLHTACMYHHTKVVLVLIKHKANLNVRDNLGQTPLFKSIFNGYIDIVDILLKHGASVDICDNSGKSPLAIAEIKGHNIIVDVLCQYRPINQIV